MTKATSTRDGVEVKVAALYAAFDVTASPDGTSLEANNQKTLIHVKNADAAAHVIHIFSTATVDGRAVKDVVTSMAANTEYFFGPFSNADWGTSSVIYIDVYDASGPSFDADDDVSGGTKDTTGVTVLAIVLGAL